LLSHFNSIMTVNVARGLTGGETEESEFVGEFGFWNGSKQDLLADIELVIKSFQVLMKEVRAELKGVVGDKRILVFDAAFDLPSINMAARLSKLRHAGLNEVHDCIGEGVFDGEIPSTVTAFMQNLLGGDVNLIHRDVRDGVCSLDGFDALILGGSPACVTASECDDLAMEGEDLTHKEVFDLVAEIHNRAMVQGMPVIGVCYGSHVLTKIHNGIVERLDSPRVGMKAVGMGKGRTFLSDFSGVEMDEFGEAYVAHADASVAFGPASKPFAMMDVNGVNVSQIAMHLDPRVARFSGDDDLDLQMIRELMADGAYSALGLQAHFELTFPHLLLHHVLGKEVFDQYKLIVKRMEFTKQILGVISGFLAAHRNFRE
jgi:GMP synthase-like glutamine amidotransferase